MGIEFDGAKRKEVVAVTAKFKAARHGYVGYTCSTTQLKIL
jgi:hypothetical protein